MRDQRVWLCLVVILPEWDEVDVFAAAQQSDILRFMPSPSLVEMEMTSGLLLRICAFAAISTGVSVMPFASFAAVFPVQGRIASASR